jgi:hypothetical protein
LFCLFENQHIIYMNRFLTLLLLFPAFFTPVIAQQLSWITNCTPRNLCLNPGSCTVANASIFEEAFTTCSFSDITYLCRIDLDNNGTIDRNITGDTLNTTLSRGTHRLYWRATDVCGRAISCSYTVTVDDCEAPALLCRGGLSTSLTEPDCNETFTSDRFIFSTSDNCTPVNQLKRGLRRQGTGTGFPATDSITFKNCNIGVNLVEVWVQDQKGKVNQCNTFVLVQENSSICPCITDANITLRGCMRSGNNAKISNFRIENTIRTEPNGQPALNRTLRQDLTDSCFQNILPKIPLGGPFRITTRATRTGGSYLDGITTNDLALISRHILNLQPFPTIYHALAADANGSNTVTTLDIVEIRRLILGITDSLPNVPSWRFIRPVATPTVVANLEAVRDTYQTVVTDLRADVTVQNRSFVGFKMGDVNFSGPTFLTGASADDRGAPVQLLLEDRWLQAGERVKIPVQMANPERLSAWQMALLIRADKIQILDMYGLLPEQFHQDKDGVLRVLWYGDRDKNWQEKEVLFEIELVALQNTLLSDALALAPSALPAEAYSIAGSNTTTRDMRLNIIGQIPQSKLLAPQPNPFSTTTEFPIQLVRPERVQCEFFDLSGKRLWSADREYPAGWHTLEVDARYLSTTDALLLYRISAGDQIKTGKIFIK